MQAVKGDRDREMEKETHSQTYKIHCAGKMANSLRYFRHCNERNDAGLEHTL